jgi:hypothetical protein
MGKRIGPRIPSKPQLPGEVRFQFRSRLERFCRNARIPVSSWIPRTQIVQLGTGKSAIRLYYRTRSKSDGFWGINSETCVRALNRRGCPWYMVLLLGPGERAHLADGNAVKQAIKRRVWSRDRRDGEYKVHDNSTDLFGFGCFNKFDDLIRTVTKFFRKRRASTGKR